VQDAQEQQLMAALHLKVNVLCSTIAPV